MKEAVCRFTFCHKFTLSWMVRSLWKNHTSELSWSGGRKQNYLHTITINQCLRTVLWGCEVKIPRHFHILARGGRSSSSLTAACPQGDTCDRGLLGVILHGYMWKVKDSKVMSEEHRYHLLNCLESPHFVLEHDALLHLLSIFSVSSLITSYPLLPHSTPVVFNFAYTLGSPGRFLDLLMPELYTQMFWVYWSTLGFLNSPLGDTLVQPRLRTTALSFFIKLLAIPWVWHCEALLAMPWTLQKKSFPIFAFWNPIDI